MEEVEADAEHEAVTGVHAELHDEVLADARAGVLEGAGHDVDVAHAGKEEQAMAQLLGVDEHVDREDDDDAELADGFEDGTDEGDAGVELIDGLADDLHADSLGRG